jgi:serine/threonine protein kinase
VEVAADKDRLQRFTQEARTVSNLNHPNFLTNYEFGQADSVCFIATEFIDGETLRPLATVLSRTTRSHSVAPARLWSVTPVRSAWSRVRLSSVLRWP